MLSNFKNPNNPTFDAQIHTFGLSGSPTVSVQIDGTISAGHFTPQVSNDGSTWFPITAFEIGGSEISTITAAGVYRCDTNGYQSWRLLPSNDLDAQCTVQSFGSNSAIVSKIVQGADFVLTPGRVPVATGTSTLGDSNLVEEGLADKFLGDLLVGGDFQTQGATLLSGADKGIEFSGNGDHDIVTDVGNLILESDKPNTPKVVVRAKSEAAEENGKIEFRIASASPVADDVIAFVDQNGLSGTFIQAQNCTPSAPITMSSSRQIITDQSIEVEVKVTLTFGMFTNAAFSEDIELYSLPSGWRFTNPAAHPTTKFNGISMNTVQLSLGLSGDSSTLMQYFPLFEIGPGITAGPSYSREDVFTAVPAYSGGATSIRAQLIADNNLNLLTQGSVDVYFRISKLP